MNPEILYEDNHLLVVNKPAGVLTQPSGTEQTNLEDICKTWIKETYQKPGNVFLQAVHRLDKAVSGIVIFARTSKALSRLNASLRSHEFRKVYYAVVEGIPAQQEGVLEDYLVHDDYHSVVADASTPQAKLCRLNYRSIKQQGHFALLEIILLTGRYHQIRVQLASSGHPIVGDVKYKSCEPYLPNAIALHHGQVQFPHPTLDKLMDIQAPLPTSMQNLVKR
jgi:23S rRNA pseudouridine1911/1915/1917 synthase